MTPPRSIRRCIALTALVAVVALPAAPAYGRTVLEGYLDRRADTMRAIDRVRTERARLVMRQRWEISGVTRRLERMQGRGAAANPERFAHQRRHLEQERRQAAVRIRASGREAQRRVRSLQARVGSIDAWLSTWGVFRECPIRGWHSIADNFGVTVRLPGVPVHVHDGNDILAYSGTPIVAPFDGYASGSSSELGGLEVRVTGERGYAYNAHLSSYGTLGRVRAGAVIGYVGATGDATTAHDHFEWHPGGGAAVDPNPYLRISCG